MTAGSDFSLQSGAPAEAVRCIEDPTSSSGWLNGATQSLFASGQICMPRHVFSFKTSADGTLAAIDLGMNGFVTLEAKAGSVQLSLTGVAGAMQSTLRVTDDVFHDVAVTYSYVRQKVVLYIDGALVGEHDARAGTSLRELFPQRFLLGGPANSGGPAAPPVLQVRDLFINRAPLHAREIEERAKTPWVGAGSLDVYAPLRASDPNANIAQTLQRVRMTL